MQLLFWTFFPEEGLALLVALAGLALMFGMRSAAAGLLGTVLAFALLGPLVETVVAGLPPFWQLLILAVFVLLIIRTLIGLLIGQRTASHLAALLLHDLILLPFRVLGRIFAPRGQP